jgi:hypothetical protein
MTTQVFVNPFDGFRGVVSESGQEHTLYVEIRGDGEAHDAVEIEVFESDQEGIAHCDRAHHLVDAICRFLNSGGSSEEITVILEKFQKMSEMYSVVPPEDYQLHACLYDVVQPTTVYLNSKTKMCLVVAEDAWCDEMSIEQVRQQYIPQDEVNDDGSDPEG